MKIAYIEDNPSLLRNVAKGLRKAGYAVDTADNGEDGLWLLENNDYDVAVLDIMLPKMDGLELLDRLRSNGVGTHIILLTAKDTVPDRIAGLRRGADDYLIKPFSFDELVARVEALARRKYGQKSPTLQLENLILDQRTRDVRRGKNLVDLSPREYTLLELLMLRAGEVVSRTEIEQHIYDERVSPMSNVVDTAIYALRRKLGPPMLIHTVRGHGYILKSEQEK